MKIIARLRKCMNKAEKNTVWAKLGCKSLEKQNILKQSNNT